MNRSISRPKARGPRSMMRGVFSLLAVFGLFAAFSYGARADDPNAKAAALIQSANRALNNFIGDPQWQALRNLLGGARAIYIAPHDTAGGFLITASGGDGVLLRRHGTTWSDPIFMHMGTVGVGFAAGGETQSIVMVIMTDAGVDGLISGVAQVGGSGGFALANLGLGGGGSGSSLAGGLQVLTVSTAQGVFAGSDIQRTQMSTQDAYNTAIYGAGYNMAGIAAAPGGQVSAAADLRAGLSTAVTQAWGQ
jgi:lipid-binding SYLF domain-containing protein